MKSSNKSTSPRLATRSNIIRLHHEQYSSTLSRAILFDFITSNTLRLHHEQYSSTLSRAIFFDSISSNILRLHHEQYSSTPSRAILFDSITSNILRLHHEQYSQYLSYENVGNHKISFYIKFSLVLNAVLADLDYL